MTKHIDPIPDEPDLPCAVCGLEAGSCTCPECPVCGAAGDPKCYKGHGLEVCVMCRRVLNDRNRVFEQGGPCRNCYEEEARRSAAEDSIGAPGPLRSRPPKYMLKPSEWKQFGYE